MANAVERDGGRVSNYSVVLYREIGRQKLKDMHIDRQTLRQTHTDTQTNRVGLT